MADPASMALALKAGSAAATGISGFAAAKGEQERAKVNSFIGRTRALQTDTTAREGLEGELGNLRAVLGANEQKAGVGTLAMVDELRSVRDRDRRIQFGARMSEAADWRMAGKNAGAKATGSLVGGMIKAGPSLFDLYDLKKKE